MPSGYEMKTKPVTKSIPDPRIEGNVQLKKPKLAKVRSKKPATVPEFIPTAEGLQAAIDYYKDKGGVAFVVDRLNTQTMTDEANRIRGALGPTNVSDTRLEEVARTRVFSSPDLMGKAMAMGGDINRINSELIEPLKAEIRKELTTGNSDDYEFIVEGEEDSEEA